MKYQPGTQANMAGQKRPMPLNALLARRNRSKQYQDEQERIRRVVAEAKERKS